MLYRRRIQSAVVGGRHGTRAGGEAAAATITDALPEPLSLDHALSLANEPHPDLQVAAAETDIAQAQLDRARADYGINAGVNAEANWIEPSQSPWINRTTIHRPACL